MGNDPGRERGISLPELLVSVAIVAVLATMAVPASRRVVDRAHLARLATDGRVLASALLRWQADHGTPPPAGATRPDGFNTRTLDPLVSRGYLLAPAPILGHLAGNRVTVYDAPGAEPGAGRGFWLVLTDGAIPGLQVVVASTDAFPLAPGTWVEGIYLLRGDRLERIDRAPLPTTFRGGRDG